MPLAEEKQLVHPTILCILTLPIDFVAILSSVTHFDCKSLVR